jgi:membrane protein DedA with SNARE-associated domain
MEAARIGRSVPELLTDAVAQIFTLLRKEGQLARAEISDNIGQAAAALGLLVGGAVLLIPALVILLQAAVAALAETGMAIYWAAVIVGGIALILGLVLLFVGANRLKAGRMIPNKTINQLQRDALVAKEQVRQRDELYPTA